MIDDSAHNATHIIIPREQVLEFIGQLAEAQHEFDINRRLSAIDIVKDVTDSFQAIIAGNYSPEITYETRS